jgi:3-oxoacyl-[acyl-carrier protein] reductase
VLAKSFRAIAHTALQKAVLRPWFTYYQRIAGTQHHRNAVAPGPTGTDLFFEGKSQNVIDHLANMNTMERLGTPSDISNAVSFLAGSDGGWVNAQVIRVNGGFA